MIDNNTLYAVKVRNPTVAYHSAYHEETHALTLPKSHDRRTARTSKDQR